MFVLFLFHRSKSTKHLKHPPTQTAKTGSFHGSCWGHNTGEDQPKRKLRCPVAVLCVSSWVECARPQPLLSNSPNPGRPDGQRIEFIEICMHIWCICLYINLYVCMYVCMYLFIYLSMYECMYACMYAWIGRIGQIGIGILTFLMLTFLFLSFVFVFAGHQQSFVSWWQWPCKENAMRLAHCSAIPTIHSRSKHSLVPESLPQKLNFAVPLSPINVNL